VTRQRGEQVNAVGRKEMLETGNVAMLRCGDELFEKKLLLGCSRGGRSVTRGVLPRPRHNLPCVRLSKVKNGCDIAVRVVEGLPKDIGGSFGWRQPFQE
jgi:hypothetical protein